MSASSVIDEIKSKLDIVQVISEYIQLRKAGVNFRAPCPFHHEQDPSFFVSPDRQRWHCFGCGEDGDIFGFVMKMDGVDFPAALRHLAKKAGVVLKHTDVSEDRGRQRLYDANRWSARYYHEVLLRSPQAERARAYIHKRGLSEETVEDFMLGFAPDSWDAVLNFLRKKGFTDEEIFQAGLVSKKERGVGYFDRFRGRLMFPITDAQGNHVGFTGRIMPGSDGKDPLKEAKYVNTPETAVYRKSRILFALNKAKSEIRKQGFAVVVEGNMDAIASHQAGVRNVIASSGTAFTDEQLNMLRRLTDTLVLSFDVDAAGERAARRSDEANTALGAKAKTAAYAAHHNSYAANAVAAGFNIKMLDLPPEAGKDPDDCIRKDPQLWIKAIADAKPYMEWLIGRMRAQTDLSDPHAKRLAAADLLKELAEVPSAVERAHWLKALSEFFQTPETALHDELNQIMRRAVAVPSPARGSESKAVRPADRHQLVSELILGTLINWPALAGPAVDTVKPEYLDEGVRPLYRDFIISYNEQRTDGGDKQPLHFSPDRPGDQKTAEKIAVLQLLAEKEFGELPSDERGAALAKLVGESKKLHTSRRQRELTAAMSQAERDGDAARIQEIQQQINELIL